MGRPRGSKNRSKGEDGAATYPSNGDGEEQKTIDGDELRNFITRIEDLNAQQKEISADRQQVFAELKQGGYDRDTVREIVRKRKLTTAQRTAAEALMDEYTAALGPFAGTELGQAGAYALRSDHAE